MNQPPLNSRHRSRTGAVLIETLIVLPLLLLLLFGLFDLYRYSQVYLSLQQIVREALSGGSRYKFDAADTGAPDPSLPVTDSDIKYCLNNTTPDCRGKVVQWRVQRMIKSYKLAIDPASLSIQSHRDSGAGHGIVVSVEARYISGFSFFKGLTMQVTMRGDQIGAP